MRGLSLGLLLVLGMAAALSPLAAGPSRKVLVAHHRSLPLRFPHEKHDQPCLSCHHKVAGMRETTPCVACHEMSDPAVKLSAEPRFHQFCRSCHEEKGRGPVRDCAGCHR